MKNNKTLLYINLIFVFLTFNSNYVIAQDSTNNRFADYLFKNGEYYRAITEYYRLLYNCENADEKIKILRNIGLSYYQGMDFEGCITFLKNNRLSLLSNSMTSTETDLLLAKSYYKLNQYSESITALDWKNINSTDSLFNDFQFLSAISYARLYDEEKAINKMKLISQDSEKKEVADRFCIYFENQKVISNKSPFLAGTLSAIIPGSGYLNSKHYDTALTSFVINGLFIWAIKDAVLAEQYGIASAATVFGLGWYIGNIEGSVKAAIKQNEYERHKYLNEVLEKEGLMEYIKLE